MDETRTDTIYSDIIFFDNDTNHVRDMHENMRVNTVLEDGTEYNITIQPILVDDTIPNERIDQRLTPESYNISVKDAYANTFNTNTYADYIILSEKGEPTMPSNGITKDNVNTLYEWIANSTSTNKYAVFDWDRTLSVVEGILVPPDNDSISGYYVLNHVVEYLLGGNRRLNMIKTMFSRLHRANIQVIIITHNSVCLTSHRNMVSIIKIVDPLFDPANYLCSHETTKSKKLKEFLKFIVFHPLSYVHGRTLSQYRNTLRRWWKGPSGPVEGLGFTRRRKLKKQKKRKSIKNGNQ